MLMDKGLLLCFASGFCRKNHERTKAAFCYQGEMKTVSDTDRAYLAGLFDGEGCIFISKYYGHASRSPVYTLHTIVSMTSKEAVECCREITGLGNVYFTKSKRENWRDQWRWDAQGKEGADFLRCISPWLKVKRGQVECALELESLKAKRGGRGYIVPQSISDKREYCYRMVMNLKDERDEGEAPERPFDPQIPLFEAT